MCCKSRRKERSKELKWSYGRVEKVFLQLNAWEKIVVIFRHCWTCEGNMFAVCSKSRVCCLWREMLKSPWVCGSGCFREKHECLKKMLPRGEVTRCRSGIRHRSRHSQFWGWRKVVPVYGVLNVSDPYSTGNPWSKRNRRKKSIN